MKKTKKFFSLIVFVMAIFLPSSAAALSREQQRVIKADVLYFDVSLDPCSSSYSPRFPTQNTNQELTTNVKSYIENTRPDSPLIEFAADFVKFGSQYNVNPALTVAIAQKETSLGTAGNAAPPQYNVFNVRNGANGSFGNYQGYSDSIESVNELLSGPKYMGPPSNFTTIDEIINRYAPPSENDTQGYIKFINDVMPKIMGGEGAAEFGCNQTGRVNSEGYSFPVYPQKQSENGGVPGMSALPCQNATCHHDGTPAFDISKKPGGDSIAGTPVYAISDGEIDNLHIYKGIEGCYSLQLKSSKDNFWYFHAHLKSPSVKNGQKVKAGQKIAEIGERKCTGNGSDSHLHIDRGCVRNGVPQKGGYDSCRDAGFVPLINTLFEELPE